MSDPRSFLLERLCFALCLLALTNAASYSCPCGVTYSRTSYDCGFWGMSRCTRQVSATKMCQCVDGGWTDYTAWTMTSQCSVTCGGGYRTVSRSRTCTNPSPANGGKTCVGSTSESKTEACNTHQCPVDGGWTDFGQWVASQCSVSCGEGVRSLSRSRACTNPSPQYNGKECVGINTEHKTETCNTSPCPIDGAWADFGDWVPTLCSVSCGGGERSLSRSRTCTNPSPQYNGKNCEGDNTEYKTETCNSNPCPIDGGWTEFNEWVPTICSVSCGGGERSLSRSRTCTNPSPQYDGKKCEGANTEHKTETCNTNPCPIDGRWSEFEEWVPTPCTVSCGGGERSLSRSRTCTNPSPQYNGKTCEGDNTEYKTETCNSYPCPIDGAWCEFNELTWTQCSAHCNQTGTQTRVCECPAAQYGGAACAGTNINTETKDCYQGACLEQACAATDKSGSSLPRNCGEYVRCDTNSVPIVMPCPAGLHFDDDTGVCVEGDCGVAAEDEVESLCNVDNNGQFLADEVDCSIFYQCSNGDAIQMACPPGTIWDSTMNACVIGNCDVNDEVDEVVDDKVPECADKNTGTLLPDQNDCHKYTLCVNNQDQSMSCGPLVFDPTLLICNWESEANPCTTKP
ncbi:coadhesin-like [Pecten maximus]|uniref:coadhesin-like n=1 Tax=Pecten maximus TaxID=6579 RepID=UPI0014584F3C|nr:coadhesin-like [Pecten maximus]